MSAIPTVQPRTCDHCGEWLGCNDCQARNYAAIQFWWTRTELGYTAEELADVLNAAVPETSPEEWLALNEGTLGRPLRLDESVVLFNCTSHAMTNEDAERLNLSDDYAAYLTVWHFMLHVEMAETASVEAADAAAQVHAMAHEIDSHIVGSAIAALFDTDESDPAAATLDMATCDGPPSAMPMYNPFEDAWGVAIRSDLA